MTKNYIKPQIIFEDFSLNTSIAAGCEQISPLPSAGKCGYPIRGGVLFTDKDICTLTKADGYDGLCYHVPIDDNNLFNS